MFCSKCGAELSKDAKFCSKCGNNVGIESSYEKDQSSTTIAKEAKVNKQNSFSMLKQKWLILAIVLIVGIGFFSKDSLIYAISPEKHVLLSLNKTFKVINKDLERMSSLLFGDISETDPSTNNLKAMINDIEHSDQWINNQIHILNGMGLELNTAMDKSNKEFYLSGQTIYDGRDFLSFNTKIDDREILLDIPELYHSSFMLPSKDFGRQWNMSNIAIDNNYFMDESLDISFSELMSDSEIIKMDEKTRKSYSNSFNTFIKNASFEKNGTEKILIGDKSKKCNKISIILNSNDVKNGILELIDAVKNDNRVVQSKDNLKNINQEYAINNYEESLENLKYEINEYFKMDISRFDVYTYNGNVVQMDLNIVPDMDYKEEIIKLGISFLGDKNLVDDIKLEFVVGNDDQDKIVITSKGNHAGNKKQFSDETEITLYSYGSELMLINSKTEIDLSKNKDNLKYLMNFKSEDGDMVLDVNGDFNSSSKKIEYNLHDILFTMNDYYQGSFRIKGSLALSLENQFKNIARLNSSDKVNILELTAYDADDIMDVMETNMEEIGYSFNLY